MEGVLTWVTSVMEQSEAQLRFSTARESLLESRLPIQISAAPFTLPFMPAHVLPAALDRGSDERNADTVTQQMGVGGGQTEQTVLYTHTGIERMPGLSGVERITGTSTGAERIAGLSSAPQNNNMANVSASRYVTPQITSVTMNPTPTQKGNFPCFSLSITILLPPLGINMGFFPQKVFLFLFCFKCVLILIITKIRDEKMCG